MRTRSLPGNPIRHRNLQRVARKKQIKKLITSKKSGIRQAIYRSATTKLMALRRKNIPNDVNRKILSYM